MLGNIFSDINNLVSGLMTMKLPSGTAAALLGYEHGRSGGKKFNPEQDPQRFDDHGLPINDNTKSAFDGGALVGRFVRLYEDNLGQGEAGGHPYEDEDYDPRERHRSRWTPPGHGPFGGYPGR